MIDYSSLRVDEKRLWADLLELSRFGAEAGGLKRTALSAADLSARQWFKEQMREAGLQVKEDAAANLIGRLEAKKCPSHKPCIAFGSHIDTVMGGGRFDGALGICAGLEAMRAIQESKIPIPCPLELLVFTDEEGSHYAGTFGSRAMFGLVKEEELERSRKEGKPSLAEDLKRLGKDPGQIKKALRSPEEFKAFLELHIEQGPVLEKMKAPIGIVEGIVDLHRYLIHVKGQAGHAGTTPMELRDDALIKSAEIILRINEAVKAGGTEIVGTIGEMEIYPGVINIIPGETKMSLDLRSAKKNILTSVRKTIEEIVFSVKGAQIEPILVKEGVQMDRRVMEAIAKSCQRQGIAFHYLWSGAGHDAMTLATMNIPTGMIFVPCREGKSHCPEEEIQAEHAAMGTLILTEAIVRLAFNIFL